MPLRLRRLRCSGTRIVGRNKPLRFHAPVSDYKSGAVRLLGILLLFQVLVHGMSGWAGAADDPKKAGLVRPNKEKEKDADGEVPLLKYPDFELPSAEDLLKSKPFDWIVLKSLDVLVVEPVGPRPETLVRLNSEYERYLKGKAGRIEGIDRLSERRRRFLRVPLMLVEPGPDQDPD